MSSLWSVVEAAFQRLEAQSGFETRSVQRQMAQFVCTQLESAASGMVEAPTGVGKSLAVLLPAIAYCLREKKRVVISTYTNVLAEQYWRKDLPLALSLFPNAPGVALAMGRSRYACLDAIRGDAIQRVKPELVRYLREWTGVAEEGVESELNEFLRRKGIPAALMRDLWETIAVPSACRAKACPYYHLCFYYTARRRAAQAGIVITNHAFVLTDALVRQTTNDENSLLDEYDFLILDEAHDLLDAAASTLEFTLDTQLVESLIRHAATLSNQISNALVSENPPMGFIMSVQKLVEQFAQRCRDALVQIKLPRLPDGGVAIRVAPPELAQMPALNAAYRPELHSPVAQVAASLQAEIHTLRHELNQTLQEMKSQLTDAQRQAVVETITQFSYGFEQVYQSLGRLAEPQEGVSWVEPDAQGWKACYAPLALAEWLRAHLWNRRPALLMSATLTVDGRFDFFEEQLGLQTPHRLQLPPVFDYSYQCALYLPPVGAIPPPPASARAPGADAYYQRLAEQIAALIQLTQGRALVLFASRAEMQAVHQRMPKLPFRILIQGESANADLSKQFREDVHSVLFGLRSFWTGFDAPGETLMNLILTRIPFEVPTTPLQRARQAWYEARGENAFARWTLPMAKQQMRQGFGRLIRRASDVGIVAILDPRMRSKAYGIEILNNLPAGIPIYDSLPALANWLQQRANWRVHSGGIAPE
ncbi:MAG: ATP-dependent DNA helicase [Fimbriimonadales bacterium]|nr:ATP-dependent DNA helicase [Fimbriimonadales bacterium]